MRFFLAALLVGTASAGCLANNLVSCATFSSSQQACQAGAQLGCVWANGACALDSSVCSSKTDMASCNAVANVCSWNDPNMCDASDILSCVGASSPFQTCFMPAYQLDALTAVYANLSVTVDLSAHIQANVDRMLCSCMPLYFSCILNGDCGRDAAWQIGLGQACTTTFQQMAASRPGLAACSTSWCNGIGRTRGVSTFTVTFTFSASNLPSTWSQDKKDAFIAALNAELAGVDRSWLSFDASTGKATVSIPSGTNLSPAQLDSIKASFNSWSNPSSSNAAPMFNAMGVEGAQVTAEPAPIESRASTGSRTVISSGLFALVAVALAFAKLV